MNIKIAVGVGYNFAVVPVEMVQHIRMTNTGVIVTVQGVPYVLYKASTYEGSREVDAILDRPDVVEIPLSKVVAEKVLDAGQKTYEVTFARTGVAHIRCRPEELESKINGLGEKDITWTDDWESTDCQDVSDDDTYSFVKQLENIYAKDTCHHSYRGNWTEQNPSIGHCAIVSLLIYHYTGYPVYKVRVGSRMHYYNVMPDGTVLDATSQQFGRPIDYTNGIKCNPTEMLKVADTLLRFNLLKKRFEENIHGEK